MRIDICLISDEKYAIYLGTVIVSILKNSNDNDELFLHIINTGMSKNSIDKKIINTITWWIPIKKWCDNFRNKFAIADQTGPNYSICINYICFYNNSKYKKIQTMFQYKIVA